MRKKLICLPVIDTIEDNYAYYVLINGVSENLFWNADFDFLVRAVRTKCIYDAITARKAVR